MNLLGYKEPNLVHLSRCKVTFINIWLLFNLLFPFTIVLLHSWIQYQRARMTKVGSPVKFGNISSLEDFSSWRPLSRWAALSRRRRGAESDGQTPIPWSLLGPLSQR